MAHCRSKKHARLAADAGAVREDLDEAPEGTILCRTCNMVILPHLWSAHVSGRRHASAVSFHATRTTLQAVSKNRHSVEVSGNEEAGYDFGIVEPEGRLATIPIDIDVTGHGIIYLVDVRISSMTGTRKFTPQSQYVNSTHQTILRFIFFWLFN